MKATILFLIFFWCAFSPCFAKDEWIFLPAFDAGISTITYKEPTLMQESGTMYFLDGALTERFNSDFFMREEIRYSYGLVNYDGGTSGGSPLTINGIPDSIMEAQWILGNDIPSYGSSVLTPYFGFGFRFLQDNLQVGPGGYRRESNYLYNPLGFELMVPINKGSSWGAAVEYDALMWGKQVSCLSDVDPGYHDVMNEQENGSGLRGYLKYTFVSDGADLEIKLFERTWSIEESVHKDLTKNGVNIGTVWEPKNISTEIGLSLSLKY
jgi:hypothetical protein